MFGLATTFNFFEFWPLVGVLVTAGPAFFQIVKDRLSTMEITRSTIVVRLEKVMITAGSFALLLSFDHFKYL